MILRKIYLKIWLFIYSIRKLLNRLAVIFMITTLLYLFLNQLLFNRIILAKADSDMFNKNYDAAIGSYNLAYVYYKINHFSSANKELYYKIPYNISTCYLIKSKKKEAINTMVSAITEIQTQYGIYSHETADFMRKYLIKFYLDNNKTKLAEQEFKNLMTIYKNVGYSDNEMSDLIRLKGDIYYAQRRYDLAINLYQQAYKSIATKGSVDYEVFSRIVDRMCAYDVANGDVSGAIQQYETALKIFQPITWRDKEFKAQMLINLANLYIQQQNKTKQAIAKYVEAIDLIKQLPRNDYLKQHLTEHLNELKELYNQDGQFHKVDEIDVELARRRRFNFL